MKSLYLSILLSLLSTFSFAQEDGTFIRELFELRHKKNETKFVEISKRYAKHPKKIDIINVEKAIAEDKTSSIQLPLQNNELSPKEDFVVRTQGAILCMRRRDYLKANKLLDSLQLPITALNSFEKAELNRIHGLIYSSWDEYFLSIKHFTKSEEQFIQANSETGLLATYYNTVVSHLQSYEWNLFKNKMQIIFPKYEKAISKYPALHADFNTALYSRMFLAGELDSALMYIHSNIPIYKGLNDSGNVMKTYLNIAFTYAKANKPDLAYTYFSKSQEYSTQLDDRRQEIRILISMISLLYEPKYYSSILKKLGFNNIDSFFKALKNKVEKIDDKDLRQHFLRQKVLYYQTKGQKDLIIKAQEDENDFLYDLQIMDTTNLQLLQYQLQLEVKKNKILSLTVEKKRNENILYIGILILFAILGFAIWRYTKKNAKERKVKEINAQKVRESEEELNSATIALKELKKIVLEKTKIIETITNELELNDAEKAKHSAKLKQMKILTEDDWINFKKLFALVYPKMSITLMQKKINPTEGELRILMLLKMKFHKNEISEALGIGPESARKAIYRLKNKIQPIDLEDLLLQS